MPLHEALVSPPGDPGRLNGIALRTRCNLLSMQIMQPQFIKQRLLDDLVREQEWLDSYGLQQPAESPREMTIYEDRMAVAAGAGNVRNVVFAIDDPDPAAYGLDDVEEDSLVNVFRLMANFAFKFHWPRPISCLPNQRSAELFPMAESMNFARASRSAWKDAARRPHWAGRLSRSSLAPVRALVGGALSPSPPPPPPPSPSPSLSLSLSLALALARCRCP